MSNATARALGFLLLLVSAVGVRAQGADVRVVVAHERGWNLLSLPVSGARPAAEAFPGAVSVYGFVGGALRPADTVEPGRGYWALFEAAGELAFSGPALASAPVDLEAGWNLVGALSEAAPVRALVQRAGGAVVEVTDPGAGGEPATALRPGRAYWVRATAPASFALTRGVVAEDVVVLPGSARLVSDSAEVAGGTYRIAFDGTPPAVSVGDVVAGTAGEASFFRRVTSVEASGTTFALTTTQATLDEVFEDARLDAGAAFDFSDAGASGRLWSGGGAAVDYAAPGVRSEGGRVAFEAVDLGAAGLTLSGSLGLTADADFAADVEGGALRSASVGVSGTLDAAASVTASLTAGASGSASVLLLRSRRPVTTFVGLVPVVTVFTLEVRATASASAESRAAYSYAYTHRAPFTAGFDYAAGRPPVPRFETADTWDGRATVELVQKSDVRVGLEVVVLVRTYVAPFVALGPTLSVRADGHAESEATPRGQFGRVYFTSGGGVEANLEAFGDDTAYPVAGFGPRATENVWEGPSEVEAVAGVGQSGPPEGALPDPVTVRVRSGGTWNAPGGGMAGVPVHFAVVSGGGSVPAAPVLTDERGTASVAWTLGRTGTQRLRAEVRGPGGAALGGDAFEAVLLTPTLAVESGDGQSGTPGEALEAPLVVRASFPKSPARGHRVTFEVTSGGGAVTTALAVTDDEGLARTGWTPGASGDQRVRATLYDLGGAVVASVVFQTGSEIFGLWRVTQHPDEEDIGLHERIEPDAATEYEYDESRGCWDGERYPWERIGPDTYRLITDQPRERAVATFSLNSDGSLRLTVEYPGEEAVTLGLERASEESVVPTCSGSGLQAKAPRPSLLPRGPFGGTRL